MKLSFVLFSIIQHVSVLARHRHDSSFNDESRFTDYEHYENLVSTYDKKMQKCCNGFVHQLNLSIAPDQLCCGGNLYNDQTHECCGDVVYEFNSTTECCNGKTYSRDESRCCSSVLGNQVIVKIPLDIVQKANTATNIMCCGLQLYDESTYRCCPVRQFKYLPIFSDYLTATKYYTEEEYDRRVEDMLNMYIRDVKAIYYAFIQHALVYKTTAKNVGKAKECHKVHNHKKANSFGANSMKFFEPFQNDPPVIGICNNISFNIFTHVCCSVTTLTGTDTIHESKLHNRKSKVTQCCGLEIYDFSMEICCNNTIHPQSNNFCSACCGNQIYDVTKQVCCDWSDTLVNATSLPGFTDRCCGNSKTPYSPDNEICCGGTVTSNPNEPEACQGLDDDDQCPSRNKSSANNNICCDNRIVMAKESATDNKCCGNTTYLNSTNICCIKRDLVNQSMTEIQLHREKNWDTGCCGKEVYNTAFQSCCDGKIFDPYSELCCLAGKRSVVVQTKSKSDVCCGTLSYDPETERCCNGSLIDAPASYLRCCGSLVYNPNEELCCRDKIYQPTSKIRMKCCGDKMIDGFKQMCCHGAVKDVANPLKVGCCYKPI